MVSAEPDNAGAPAARVVVLASGTGTLAQSVVDATSDSDCPYRVVALVSDRDCEAVTRAGAAGVDTTVVAPGDHADRAAWNQALTDAVQQFEPDWVVSAGFMRILGQTFLEAFPCRVINTHPALLPSFPGAHAVPDALAHGVKVTGTTVHIVDAGVDTGPILAQEAVVVEDGDTVDTLHERIKIVERRLLVDVLHTISERGITRDGRKAKFS